MRNKLLTLSSIIVFQYTYFNTCQAQASVGKEKTPTVSTDSMSKFPEPEMILVERGSFTMGLIHDATKSGFGATPKTHPVTVSSFMIGKYEFSQAEWNIVMGDSLNLSL